MVTAICIFNFYRRPCILRACGGISRGLLRGLTGPNLSRLAYSQAIALPRMASPLLWLIRIIKLITSALVGLFDFSSTVPLNLHPLSRTWKVIKSFGQAKRRLSQPNCNRRKSQRTPRALPRSTCNISSNNDMISGQTTNNERVPREMPAARKTPLGCGEPGNH